MAQEPEPELIRSLSPLSLLCQARYIFKDREAFEAYRRDHGPRLQKEGLATFPLELGLRYKRSMGDVLFSC